jgi:hypothetical protein
VLAVNCLLFVTNRSRLPAVVPLAILASLSLPLFVELVRGVIARRGLESLREAARLGAAVAVAAAVVLNPFWSVPLSDPREMTARAAAAGEASGKAAAMLEELSRVEQAAPSTLEDRLKRARLLGRLHRHTEAHAALTALVHEGVREFWVHENYLEYLLWLGAHEDAVAHLRRLRDEAPALHDELVAHYSRGAIGGSRAIVSHVMRMLILPRVGVVGGQSPQEGAGEVFTQARP